LGEENPVKEKPEEKPKKKLKPEEKLGIYARLLNVPDTIKWIRRHLLMVWG
jgi:hypothetical protein